jgi:hypothetical protein
MGIQLNLGRHISLWEEFGPFLRPEHIEDMQWVRGQAKAIANTKPSANQYFRSLPFHRTLSDILNDRTLWVSYFKNGGTLRGYCISRDGKKFEIGLTDLAFRNRQLALGTLIHELAHVGGAPANTSQAEDAVYHCGLGTFREYELGEDDSSTPYDPLLIG